MKTILTLASLAIGTQAFANTTSTAKANNIWSKLEKSPWTMSFGQEIGLDTKGTQGVTGVSDITWDNNISSSYSIKSTGTRFGFFTRVRSESSINRGEGALKAQNERGTTYSERTVVSVNQSLLNQDDHGLNLSTRLEKRYFLNNKIRRRRNYYGLNRIRLAASKSFDSGFSTSATLLYAVIDRLDTQKTSTTRNYLYLVTNQSYEYKKFSFGLTEEVIKSYKESNQNPLGVYITADVNYQITPKLGVFASVGTASMYSYVSKTDNLKFDREMMDKVTSSVGFSYKLF